MPFAGIPRSSSEYGPVKLHRHAQPNRMERGFDAVASAYLVTFLVATVTGILAKIAGGAMDPLFLGATGLTAIIGVVRIFSANRKIVGSFLLSLPLLIIGLPLTAGFLGWLMYG